MFAAVCLTTCNDCVAAFIFVVLSFYFERATISAVCSLVVLPLLLTVYALSIYWKFQSDPSSLQESLPRPDRLRDTAGTVKPLSARDQTTDQVGNDQAITCGFL